MKKNIIELSMSDDVKLQVCITEKMCEDWRMCEAEANVVGSEGYDCDRCSLNAGSGDVNICEMPVVTDYIEKLSNYQDMDCTGCIHTGNKQFCLNCYRGGCRDYYLEEEKNE